jgi:hypothetical protein
MNTSYFNLAQPHRLRRITLLTCRLVLSTLLTASLVFGQNVRELNPSAEPELQTRSDKQWWQPVVNPRISFSPVLNFSTLAVLPGTGTLLVRNRDSVFATVHTTGLTPGTAVTLWFAIFNNPQNCAAQPCTPADLANPAVRGSVASAGGKIIGPDGAATFGAFRAVGDTTGVFSGMGTAEGLLDALKAEIHLVARNHGPALLNEPVTLNQQLTLFNGGCPPNACANVQASIHKP